MRIWLITVGEPLPTDGTGERLLRTGLLAETLSVRGHQVDFWTSSFDHTAKQQRCEHSQVVDVNPNYRVRMLFGSAYKRNVSVARFRNHAMVAREFARLAPLEEKPDVILCSMPLWELCDAATKYGKKNEVPTLLDIRDMWPDAIVDLAPRLLRPFVRIAAYPAYQIFRRSICNATAVTGMTQGAIDWAVTHANRTATLLDRPFPFGYRSRQPSPDAIQEGWDFWRTFSLEPNNGEFIICFFGAIGPHFDIDTIIAAAKRLNSHGRRVRFVLCGTGDHLQRWREKAQTTPQVVLPGWVNAGKIWTLMRMSSAGIAPYHPTWDFQLSLPNKPIEYLSGGLPVISSLTGELQHLLAKHECGATYQLGNPAQLAQIIEELIDDPEKRQQWSDNAYELYQKNFIAEKIYGTMSDFLEELALQGRKHSKFHLHETLSSAAA